MDLARDTEGFRTVVPTAFRTVQEVRTFRIEGLLSIRPKKRAPYATRLPSGRVVAVRGKLEPKFTAWPRFRDYIGAFGTAPPE